jgi:uncharacterized protein DUF998
MTRTVHRYRPAALAACGIAAPLVYTAAAITAGLRDPHYSHLKNFVSELGAAGAPGAGVMNFAGFLPYGILIMLFALGIHRGMRPDAGGWLGPTVLGLYGLAYVALAFAPCDPGCQALAPPSLHHQVHLLLGDIIFLTIVVGPFALYPRMVNDPDWRALATATLLLPASAWLILNVSLIGSILGVAGAIRQRVALLLIFTWIELAAIRLMRPGLGSSPG